jgi:hypothetical protein
MDKLFRTAGLALIIILLGIFAKAIILQGHPTVNLATAPQPANAVSVALGPNSGNNYLPVAGRDYTLQDTHYFDHGDWAVTTVKPVSSNADTVYVVLEKINGNYQAVIKPGNLFSSSYFYSLPSELAEYLDQKGALGG